MSLPPGFRFGVATAGYQIEGGYNGPGEPRNNWYRWESSGRVEPSGIANDFWNRYEDQLDRAAAIGCDAFRLSVEWARCEPAEGALDDTAFERYGAILDACHERGLEPLVTLHHFTHPHWLGERFWTAVDAPERFAAWVGHAVDRLGDRCRLWVTTNEPNILAVQTYLTAEFPPGRLASLGESVRAIDHLMAGHVLAYDEVRRRRPDAVVATNTYALTLYELDRLLLDVLLARRHDVGRHDLGSWLVARRDDWHRRLGDLGGVEAGLRRVARAVVPLDQALPRTVAAVYDSDHDCTLDVVQVDYYLPTASAHFRRPGHVTAGGRNWLPYRMLWDDGPDPDGLAQWCRLNAEPGLPVWIVENGLCNRVRRGRAYDRVDGWDRVRYLRENLAAVDRAVAGGVPIEAYFHWTLADNYEWGSYEPRFGLHGVDRARGARWSDRDSMGGDAAGAYRELIRGLRG